ncbi:MAG TPA: extracellular solute-binding protein [Symbiobacteriaceae bacterium]|nr:extracellular solute-binding protein [Symbiobacteriaceae bacterium]
MRSTYAVATVTMTLLLAVGCSSLSKAPPASQVTTPARAEAVTIKVGATQQEKYYMEKILIPAFVAAHPDYLVEVVTFEDRDQQPMKEAIRAGQVDVVCTQRMSRAEIPLFIRELDAYLAKDGGDLAPYGPVLDGLRRDGRTYDLPYLTQMGMFVYNVDMTKAAGVTIPADGWTWDQFRAAVAKLSQGVGNEKIWGLETDKHEMLTQLWVEGKTGKPVWEAELNTLREAIGLFHTMAFTDESLVPAPAWTITAAGTQYSYGHTFLGALKGRKAAMGFEESVDVSSLLYLLKQFPWDVAPMPSVPGRHPVVPVYPFTLGMAAGTGRPDAAWDFISFAAGPEGAAVLARAGHMPAYRTEATRKAWDENQAGYPPGVNSMWHGTWRLSSYTSVIGNEPVQRHAEFQKAQNWALSGRKSVKDALGWFVAHEGGT